MVLGKIAAVERGKRLLAELIGSENHEVSDNKVWWLVESRGRVFKVQVEEMPREIQQKFQNSPIRRGY